MSEQIDDFLNWIEALPVLWAYVAILLIAYGENVVPPIPGDMVVVFGGYLVGLGKLNFALVVLLATVGGALGFMTMYALGRKLGQAIIESDRVPWIPRKQVDSARQWLERWGYGLIAANRFLSGLRSVISLVVGMAGTPVLPTTFFAAVSALVWTGLIAYGGYAVGENWTLIVQVLQDYGQFVVGLVLIIAVAQLMRWYWKRRRSPRNVDEGSSHYRSTKSDDPLE